MFCGAEVSTGHQASSAPRHGTGADRGGFIAETFRAQFDSNPVSRPSACRRSTVESTAESSARFLRRPFWRQATDPISNVKKSPTRPDRPTRSPPSLAPRSPDGAKTPNVESSPRLLPPGWVCLRPCCRGCVERGRGGFGLDQKAHPPPISIGQGRSGPGAIWRGQLITWPPNDVSLIPGTLRSVVAQIPASPDLPDIVQASLCNRGVSKQKGGRRRGGRCWRRSKPPLGWLPVGGHGLTAKKYERNKRPVRV